MKKGFTLSEILMALVIIGIIAVVVMQVITGIFQKKSLESQFKKHYSELSQIAIKVPAETGGDCNNANSAQIKSYIIDNMNYTEMTTITKSTGDSFFEDYTQYTYTGAEANTRLHQNCLIGNSNWVSSWGTAYKAILVDGSYFGVCSHGSDSGNSNSNRNGVFISIDINGDKKPNKFGYDIWNFHLNIKTCTIESSGTYRNYLEDEDGYGSNATNAIFLKECSKSAQTDYNGFSCAEYAISNKNPDNENNSYFDSL